MIEFGTKLDGETYIYRPCAYAVLINEEGLIGIVENPKGCFLVGGGIDGEEDPITALEREALEEIGMSVQVIEKIGEAADHDSHVSEGNVYYSKSSHFYKAKLLEKVAPPIELDHELKWITFDEALEHLFFEGQRWAVKKCF
ncbi:MAG: 8-oxo-dGTP diphosphatase [Oceanicoccus sp.]|jgi:8-oxo-dGTP diphosphatase